jgi:hypothetical protein
MIAGMVGIGRGDLRGGECVEKEWKFPPRERESVTKSKKSN